MKEATSPFPLPHKIDTRLTELRGLIVRFVACQAFVVTAIWLISAFWIFGLIDYLPSRMGAAESPRIVRSIMLGIFSIGALYLIYRLFWQRWIVQWTNSSLALLIERNHPEFQSALVTTVQAAQPAIGIDNPDRDHPKRPGLLELARTQALHQMERVDVAALVRFRPLQSQFLILGSLLATSCLIGMFQPQWSLHWSRRLFALSNDPWPRMAALGVTGVELDVPTFTGRTVRQRYLVPFQDGIASVPKGQSCQLKSWASLTAKLVPDACTVYYRDPLGNRGRANMRRMGADKDRQSFVLDGPPLESLSESLWLTIAGGDVRISNLQLQSVEAPLITELILNATYPDYLQRSTKTVWGKESIPYRTGMRLPEGTKLSVTAHTNKPILRCEYILMKSGMNAEQENAKEHALELGSESHAMEIPVGILDGNLLLELRLWDADGICSTRVQQFVISTILDQPPRVDLVLKGIGTAVTENAVLPIAGRVQDDYEVREAWLDAAIETTIWKSPLSPDADGNVLSRLDLKGLRDGGQFDAKVGSTIGLTLSADDYLNLSDQPHVGRANPISLNIVTPDQLLIGLERRELAMRARLEQIIGELTQMRDLMVNMAKVAKGTKGQTSELPIPAADPDDEENRNGDEENSPRRVQRLQLLRSQQAGSQLAKSEGELRGVEREIDQINQELINNRIDSADRRTRLEDKIRKPLAAVLDVRWPPMASDITSLERHLLHPDKVAIDFPGTLDAAISENNEVIAALYDILKDMIDIQDFNELVDMVRSMIDDENKVIEQTKQEQKNKLLDLLK